ncbi:hypothetical protein COV18_00750 [Candidatus Woesearchaeota archaeon CG10_big_fil_rev_8_21_14_0_10_37_12]|nr:MAG: hypothetical protein COV18_00750 [Candidatus Woesearchaeota archaeon CG10_big_fil_rev_8_21_14_0_10_37_12]
MMSLIESYFVVFLLLQLVHSIEEITNKFNKKFPLFRMRLSTFILFEILFFGFFLAVFLISGFPAREQIMAFFNILMFANGSWHLVWWGIEKKYVPGLFTAPFFVILFLMFYFQVLF